MNSLGINKPKKETKIVVAMSGGVDSSVVAALMKQEGYDVTGITLKLYDDSKQSKEGRQCCAGQDILDAKRVSEKIDINHKILFYQKKFKSEVIDSFIDDIGRKIVTKYRVMEVSLVPIPADKNAGIGRSLECVHENDNFFIRTFKQENKMSENIQSRK